MNKTETRWVIVGRCGLYTGQWITRADAIKSHTRAWYDGYPSYAPVSERRRLWQECRKRGDRAVKATVSWKAP